MTADVNQLAAQMRSACTAVKQSRGRTGKVLQPTPWAAPRWRPAPKRHFPPKAHGTARLASGRLVSGRCSPDDRVVRFGCHPSNLKFCKLFARGEPACADDTPGYELNIYRTPAGATGTCGSLLFILELIAKAKIH